MLAKEFPVLEPSVGSMLAKCRQKDFRQLGNHRRRRQQMFHRRCAGKMLAECLQNAGNMSARCWQNVGKMLADYFSGNVQCRWLAPVWQAFVEDDSAGRVFHDTPEASTTDTLPAKHLPHADRTSLICWPHLPIAGEGYPYDAMRDPPRNRSDALRASPQ
eukprot:gene14125-biopygen7437